MNKEQAEELKKQAQETERAMGLRKFGDCPVCDDHILEDGSCCYCDWNDKLTPEETCKKYNAYWVEGRADDDKWKRSPKTPQDFR